MQPHGRRLPLRRGFYWRRRRAPSELLRHPSGGMSTWRRETILSKEVRGPAKQPWPKNCNGAATSSSTAIESWRIGATLKRVGDQNVNMDQQKVLVLAPIYGMFIKSEK